MVNFKIDINLKEMDAQLREACAEVGALRLKLASIAEVLEIDSARQTPVELCERIEAQCRRLIASRNIGSVLIALPARGHEGLSDSVRLKFLPADIQVPAKSISPKPRMTDYIAESVTREYFRAEVVEPPPPSAAFSKLVQEIDRLRVEPIAASDAKNARPKARVPFYAKFYNRRGKRNNFRRQSR